MQLVRISEASRKYDMSRSTFYRWHCYRKFPNLFARVGKIVFVDETELRKIARESKKENLNSNINDQPALS